MQTHSSKIKHLLFTFYTLLLSTTAQAAPTPAKSQILWDNWYAVTENGAPNSYYNEKVETLGDRVKIQVNSWIKSGAQVTNENLGASAKNTTLLEPLLYNFRSTEGGVEKSIDGTILNNGKVFSVRITKGGIQNPVPLKAEMLPKLILASFFPVWIHKNYKRITGVQPIEFMAIVEDQVDKQVPVIKGTAYEMRDDAFSKETKTRKLRIEFNKIVAFWYVTKEGDAVKIQIPALKKEVLKTTKEKATASLNP